MFPKFEVPNLEELAISTEILVQPDVTVATIETFYNELKSSWEVGEQTATVNGEIVSRTYSELDFNNAAPESLELIELGYYDDTYEGSKYYRIISNFNENEYFSSISEEHENFIKWESSRNLYLQEIISKHAIVNTLRWDRPFIVAPCIGSTCEILYGTPGTLTTTGTGSGIPRIINGVQTSIQYVSLPIPYVRTIFVGPTLGAVVTCNGNFTVKLKSTLEDEGIVVDHNGTILLTKSYIEITVIGTTVTPTFIQVDLYGVELWRSYAPISIDEEPDILIHSTNTSNKYKPPGKDNLPDNFWNSNPDIKTYENFSFRQRGSSTWI